MEEKMEIQGYNLPDDLYYEENHFWVRDDGDLLVMGMDDFAQQMAGEIVYVQLPDEGKIIKAGKKFAKMESGKWLGKVYGPVNGELVAVNEENYRIFSKNRVKLRNGSWQILRNMPRKHNPGKPRPKRFCSNFYWSNK
jgi:hypothetical protein